MVRRQKTVLDLLQLLRVHLVGRSKKGAAPTDNAP